MKLRRDAKVDLLRGVPLFAECTKKELDRIAAIADEFALPEGAQLIEEGKKGREFFVLVEGTVDVTRGGKQIATRGAGDFVGEIALLTETRRTATVRAATPVRCLILMRGDFRRVLDENRSIERKVMDVLAERLAEYAADSAI